MNWTLIFTFQKRLTLAHLERSLYSLSRQTVKPSAFVFFDNNSDFSPESINQVVSQYFHPDTVEFYFCKHHRNDRTLSWCANTAIRMTATEHFIMTRADFIYDFGFCQEMLRCHRFEPMSYVTSWMFYMPYLTPGATHGTVDHHADLEPLNWRENPQRLLQNNGPGCREERAGHQDGPCYCTSKTAMEAAGWYDETLIGWGFDQQDLQTTMMRKGVAMKVAAEFLYFHMEHDVGVRDVERAKEIWLKSPRRPAEILAEEKRLKDLQESKRWKFWTMFK